MIVRRMVAGFCLFCFAFAVKMEKPMDAWTVEPFPGSLTGKTIIVTQKIWDEGTLTRSEPEGPLWPEIVFALRCLRNELPDVRAKVEYGSAYSAAVILPDQETKGRLLENAWRFGLIADGKPEETGERVLLRYVGPIHAAAMRALDMDLETYLLFLRRAGRAVLNRNGRAVAWIIRVPEGEAVSFTLPEGAAWEISGDSAGGVIIAVRSGC